MTYMWKYASTYMQCRRLKQGRKAASSFFSLFLISARRSPSSSRDEQNTSTLPALSQVSLQHCGFSLEIMSLTVDSRFAFNMQGTLLVSWTSESKVTHCVPSAAGEFAAYATSTAAGRVYVAKGVHTGSRTAPGGKLLTDVKHSKQRTKLTEL